jgi:hypothetical protein
MRTIMVTAALWAIAGAAFAQDTIKAWRVGTSTICGLRRVEGRVQRFVADETRNGLAYDFAPSDGKWHDEWCDRDPNAPPPTYESIIAQVTKPTPTCVEFEARWAKMPAAQRQEIEAIRSRPGYHDVCTPSK